MKVLQNYENVTIANIYNIIEAEYITDFIFDADSKTIQIEEDQYLVLSNKFDKVYSTLKNILNDIYKALNKCFKVIYSDVYDILNKKITKQRFRKLLQSRNIQRNEINKIIKDNNQPYTYLRFYEIVK